MLVLVTLAIATATATPSTEWPVYRHNRTLTSVSPITGNLTQPSILLEHPLGVPAPQFTQMVSHRQPHQADLDGDGNLENVVVTSEGVTVQNAVGRTLWSFTYPAKVGSSLLRLCPVLLASEVPQVVVFTKRMDTGEGRGYCFDFSDGVERGYLAWSTEPLTGQHAPTLVIDDVDGDDQLEIVTAPHYRVQIFDAQTGKLEAEVPWQVGRNYGLLTTRPSVTGSHYKDIYIISDFVLHVDCIRHVNGAWRHAWGHRYVKPNSPQPRGREKYIRVGPHAVNDIDGDGVDELVYMLLDAKRNDGWHLIARDATTGNVELDVPGIWLWSIVELDGHPPQELVFSRTNRRRPRRYADLEIGRWTDDHLDTLTMLSDARPLLTQATLPDSSDTIADEGRVDIVQADFNGNGKRELVLAVSHPSHKFEDRLVAVALNGETLETTWQFRRPNHAIDLAKIILQDNGFPNVIVHDRTSMKVEKVDAKGVSRHEATLSSGKFQTTPIVADLDDKAPHEIIVQSADQNIVALTFNNADQNRLIQRWSLPGVAMNHQPGYTMNGQLCPQAADVTGDGRSNVLFAAEDDQGWASIVCVNGHGHEIWRRSFPECAWGGLQAGVNLWTFGHFSQRKQGLDVYVDMHRNSKGSSEGWVLRGDTGEIIWTQRGLIAAETAMPFGGGLPAVADVNQDGSDDIIQAFFTVYGAISGTTGEPLLPPRFLTADHTFGKWVAYSSPTLADLTGDHQLDVYLNSASYARGAYAAVTWHGEPLWAEFHNNDHGSNGFGPVGDLDGDGKLEVVVPVLDGSLLCLDGATGTHKWKVQTPVTGDVIAADINNDHSLELIFSGTDGQLHALRGTDGSSVWSIAAPGRPIIADVTGDGLAEILSVGPDSMLRIVGQQ